MLDKWRSDCSASRGGSAISFGMSSVSYPVALATSMLVLVLASSADLPVPDTCEILPRIRNHSGQL